MVLRPGIEVDDLTKIIKEDFDNDSQDKVEADDKNGDGQPPKQSDFLDEKKMFEAVFELADTWCPNIDEYEYQGFFKALENKLKYGGQQDGAAYSIMP